MGDNENGLLILVMIIVMILIVPENDDDDNDDDDNDDEAHLLTLWVLQCGGAMMAGTQLREAR